MAKSQENKKINTTKKIKGTMDNKKGKMQGQKKMNKRGSC